ncbi:MAG: hypothetical protein HYY18_17385 [Planctomycetes bacterium]|nr:hypothetical protein [Planctomycetota bacterium]
MSARLLPLLLLASAASAQEPDPSTREQATALVDVVFGRDSDADKAAKSEKIVGGLREAPGSVAAIVQAAIARAEVNEHGAKLARYTRTLLQARHAEAVAECRKLLADRDPIRIRFGTQLAREGALAVDLADDLIAQFARRDKAGRDAAQAFEGCRDDAVEKRLEALASDRERPALHALSALGFTGHPAAKPFLRRVAADPKEESDRRLAAEAALAPPDAADIALLATLLADGDEFVAFRAAGLLVDARAVLPVATLRAAEKVSRPRSRDHLDRLLCLAGEADGLRHALTHTRVGSAEERAAWYTWAGISGLIEALEPLTAALAREEDLGRRIEDAEGTGAAIARWDNLQIRRGILGGLGETGIPAAIPVIRDRLPDPNLHFQATSALARLALRTPESLNGVLEALAGDDAATLGRWQHVAGVFRGSASPASRRALFENLLGRAETASTPGPQRAAAVGGLEALAGQNFGGGADAPAKWREWWTANGKDAFKEAR